MGGAKKSVLIVDDQDNWRELLSEILELNSQFDVVSTDSYERALDIIRNHHTPFHVVITDMRLVDDEPLNEGGLQLVEYLSNRGEETNTIVVTGYATISTAKRALSILKAYDYLEKKPSDGSHFDLVEFQRIIYQAAEEAEKKRHKIDIFVVMPFEGYDHIFRYIQEVAQSMNKDCEKADKSLTGNADDNIMSDILFGIQNSEVVIAEISESNPNVFFEVGISYAWQKKVILISEASKMPNIPEILSGHRIIYYPGKMGSETELKNKLQERLTEQLSRAVKAEDIHQNIDASLCFVVTSPKDDGRDTYAAILKQSIEEVGIRDIYLWDETYWHMFEAETGKPALIEKKLREAGFVVADLSWDDPTAFYLAGLAYGLKKNYKYLYNQYQKPPFDIKHLNLLLYSINRESEREKTRDVLCEWLQAAIRKNQPTSNAHVATKVNSQGKTKRVDIILEGEFGNFTTERQQDIVNIIATLLKIAPSKIKVLSVYEGSIVLSIEIPENAADLLYKIIITRDSRIMKLGIESVLIEGKEIINLTNKDESLLDDTSNTGKLDFKAHFINYVEEKNKPNNTDGDSMKNASNVKVFINHASEDKPLVKNLYTELKNIPWLDPWLDEEKLLPGQDWEFEINKALNDSDAVLICMSNTSIKKIGVVHAEIHKAEELQKRRPTGYIFMIPVLLESCSVPDGLKRYHWLDASQPGSIDKLIQSLSTLRALK